MPKQPKTLSKLDQHRAAIKAAMPDVEAVIEKHGARIVNGCLSRMRERTRLKVKADNLRKQIKEIEEQL